MLCVALLAAVARADTAIYVANPKAPVAVQVVDVLVAAEGAITVRLHDVEGGKTKGKLRDVPASEFQSIEFREPGDDNIVPQGRAAHFNCTNGEIFRHLLLTRAEFDPRTQAMTFFLRNHDGKEGRFKSGVLRSVVLSPIPLAMREEAITAIPGPIKAPRTGTFALPAAGGGAQGGDESYLDDPDAAAPAPVTVVGGGSAAEEDKPPPEPGSFQDPNNPLGAEAIGYNAVYSQNQQQDIARSHGSGDAFTTILTFLKISLSLTVVALIVGVILLINFVIGSFVLMFSARSSGIKDLTFGKAMIASALLTIIPNGLAILCLMIPYIFCSLKLTMALFAWYFTSRTILMGMLEVMEGKAVDVLISYYAALIFLLMLLWIYAQYATK